MLWKPLVTFLALVLAQPDNGPWPMYGHDAQRTFKTSERGPTTLIRMVTELVWPTSPDHLQDKARVVASTPVISSNRTLVFGDRSGFVTMVDLKVPISPRNVLWTTRPCGASPPIVFSSAALSIDKKAYIVGVNKALANPAYLYCLSQYDGACCGPGWPVSLGNLGYNPSPAIRNNGSIVIYGSNSDILELYSVHPVLGIFDWRYIPPYRDTCKLIKGRTPSIRDGLVFWQLCNDLHVVNETSGTLFCTLDIGPNSTTSSISTWAFSENFAFAATDRFVYTLELPLVINTTVSPTTCARLERHTNKNLVGAINPPAVLDDVTAFVVGGVNNWGKVNLSYSSRACDEATDFDVGCIECGGFNYNFLGSSTNGNGCSSPSDKRFSPLYSDGCVDMSKTPCANPKIFGDPGGCNYKNSPCSNNNCYYPIQQCLGTGSGELYFPLTPVSISTFFPDHTGISFVPPLVYSLVGLSTVGTCDNGGYGEFFSAFDLTGKLIFTVPAPNNYLVIPNPIKPKPLEFDDKFYAADSGVFEYSSPSIADGCAYVGSIKGGVYSFCDPLTYSATKSQSSTRSPTPSTSSSLSITKSPTLTISSTVTRSRSLTGCTTSTVSRSGTACSTRSLSPTISTSRTSSPTSSLCLSSSSSLTSSTTRTSTFCPTGSPSISASNSVLPRSVTPTATFTRSSTPSVSQSSFASLPRASLNSTQTEGPSTTPRVSYSPTSTVTLTSSGCATVTPSWMVPSPESTPTSSPSLTPTLSPSPSISPTNHPDTPSPLLPSPSTGYTRAPRPSLSATLSITATSSCRVEQVCNAVYLCGTLSTSPSPQPSDSWSSSLSSTPSASTSASALSTFVEPPLVIPPSNSSTPSPTPSFTPTLSLTPSPTPVYPTPGTVFWGGTVMVVVVGGLSLFVLGAGIVLFMRWRREQLVAKGGGKKGVASSSSSSSSSVGSIESKNSPGSSNSSPGKRGAKGGGSTPPAYFFRPPTSLLASKARDGEGRHSFEPKPSTAKWNGVSPLSIPSSSIFASPKPTTPKPFSMFKGVASPLSSSSSPASSPSGLFNNSAGGDEGVKEFINPLSSPRSKTSPSATNNAAASSFFSANTSTSACTSACPNDSLVVDINGNRDDEHNQEGISSVMLGDSANLPGASGGQSENLSVVKMGEYTTWPPSSHRSKSAPPASSPR